MKTTVKSPVEVATTAVSRMLKSNTGTAATGCSPPNGVLTSRPQKSSPIVCNFWKICISNKKWNKLIRNHK